MKRKSRRWTDLSIQEEEIGSKEYVQITLIFLLIALVVFFLLHYSALLDEGSYYIILILLAIAASAFVFGAMKKGVATYSGNAFGGKIKLTGPILVGVLIVLGGRLFHSNTSFDFNINLQCSKNIEVSSSYPLLEDAMLLVRIGNEWRSAKIQPNGDLDFKEIPSEYRGKSVLVKLVAKYWKLKMDSVRLIGKSMSLFVVPDGSLSRIEGVVQDGSTGSILSGVIVRMYGATDTSDANGEFSLNIPLSKQCKEYQVHCEAPDYIPVNLPVTPATKKMLMVLLIKK